MGVPTRQRQMVATKISGEPPVFCVLPRRWLSDFLWRGHRFTICDPMRENHPNCPKHQFWFFFHFVGHKSVYFQKGICGKNFSGPYSIIWWVWRWVKNRSFVEVVQKNFKKIVCILLSHLSVWPRFKVIYFIWRVLVGGIWVKIPTISNFLEKKKKGENASESGVKISKYVFHVLKLYYA